MKKSLLLLLSLLAAVPRLQAQLFYFDTNGTALGTLSSFTGTDSVGTYWNTDSTGGAGGSFSSWTLGANSGTMVFSAGSNGTGGQTLSFGNNVETGGTDTLILYPAAAPTGPRWTFEELEPPMFSPDGRHLLVLRGRRCRCW